MVEPLEDRALLDVGMGGLAASALLAPVGQWDFDDPADLTAATIGTDLVLVGTDRAVAGVVPGDYLTSISALNTGREARVVSRVVLTFPESTRSDLVRDRIPEGGTRLIDCNDLLGDVYTFPEELPTDGYFQGYLIAKSSEPLTVATRATASDVSDSFTCRTVTP